MRYSKSLSYYYRVEPSGCWRWIGGYSGKYGSCRYKGRPTRAHIAMYRIHKGEIPFGLEIDHTCQHKWCVNPAHLEVVTHRENVLRGNSLQAFNAAKTHCKRGHEFTEENTYKYKDGRRDCKTCWNLR